MNITTLLPILALPLPPFRPVVVTDGPADGIAARTLVRPADPAFADLLREVQFEADLFVLQPATADAIVPALQAALAGCSRFGEGLLIADAAALQALIFGPAAPHRALLNHIWAHLTSGPTGVLYFAKALQSGSPFRVSTADLPVTCAQLRRDRLKLRRGAEVASYAHTEDTNELWAAAQEEWTRRQGGRSARNLWLANGALKCHLSAFDTFSSKHTPGAVARLFTLNGKALDAIVAHRPLRQLLTEVLAPGHGWRIQPELVAAWQAVLAAAIAKVQALRAGIPATELPAGLCATLRPYQKDGFDFLCHLSRIGQGGILADDMGLGKTLQTLAWLLWLKQQRPAAGQNGSNVTLVVCPASVMHNWRREAEQFTPCAQPGSGLKVLVLESGPGRAAQLAALASPDESNGTLVITNYALLRRDLATLQKIAWSALVLDEAQFIKNPGAQITKAVKTLTAQHRLALTGTPLENCLLDLWSIADFVAPGYLGTQSEFAAVTAKELKLKLKPILLRRLKSQVAKDLPARIELRQDCELGTAQMAFYRAELQRSRTEVFRAVDEKGLPQSKLHVLAALTRLRQICCHPALAGHSSASGKMQAFFELLAELRAAGKKVLVFSQFTRMLAILQAECQTRGIPTFLLTGDTQDRQAVVDAFNADGAGKWIGGSMDKCLTHNPAIQPSINPAPGAPPVFLLSLRAAGTGLNLTTASEVILYDPWWNPAVEAQAIDRAHRIGQTATVNAHRLITRGTIEERIWTIQQAKARTIGAVLGEGGFTRSLTKTDLEYLFGPPEGTDEWMAGAMDQCPPTHPSSHPENQPSTHPPIQQSINPANMLPRHPSHSGPPQGERNTRAAHPLVVKSAIENQQSKMAAPLWRQRRTAAKAGAGSLPAWRLQYGEN